MAVSPELRHPRKVLAGDSTTSCRIVVLYLSSESDTAGGVAADHGHPNTTDQALRLLEREGLYKLPTTRVVVVGGSDGAQDVLLHHSLRNTIHGTYLGLHAAHATPVPASTHHRVLRYVTRQKTVAPHSTSIYHRCLYCKQGNADAKFYKRINASSFHTEVVNIFKEEQLNNFNGHQLKIISVTYFPYVDYRKYSDALGGTVELIDSLDYRLLEAFAGEHNFTYEVREEPTKSWGLPKDGVFTGMMGTLQREEADLSIITAPSPERFAVMDFIRGYPSDKTTLVTLKPSLLPQYLALIRPFTREVWGMVFISVLVLGLTMWALQRLWARSFEGEVIPLQITILYSWGSLLEQPPPDLPVSLSGQVLVVCGLASCFIISLGFKTALIAHLTVQGKTRPVETFDELVEQQGWGWAAEPWLMTGIPYQYLSQHTDPVVKKLYDNLVIMEADETLARVREGSYALINQEIYITIYIASRHADSRGRTPFLISNKGISTMAAFGWGARRGAPFFHHFQQLMQRMEDAGITNKWLKEVIDRRVKRNRAVEAFMSSGDPGNPWEAMRRVVLGLYHLQGAFYILFLGFFTALVALVGENIRFASGK